MEPQEKAYHNSLRPSWGPDGCLVFAALPRSMAKTSLRTFDKSGLLAIQKGAVQSEYREIRLGRLSNESSAAALREQIRLTRVDNNKGIPTIKPSTLPSIKAFFHEHNFQNPAYVHEKLVWDLASILFDDLDVPADAQDNHEIEVRLRRQNLSRFWQTLVDDAASRCMTLARSSEEKAIACLSGHRIPEACKHLIGAKNFRLATLVSTIGTSDHSKMDILEQLEQWRDNKCLSEFSEPIRALYSLLAGEVFACSGKDIGPVEDRLSTFAISRQFGLDWKQSFGLRLWYAISAKDGVAAAVRKFHNDIQKGELRPRTWYQEQGISPIWEDTEDENREDLLWGLLKLHADPNTDMEAILRPENSQLSPLDYRLTWQLGRALITTGRASFGLQSLEKADSATLSFASQLVTEGSWFEAAFVLLHLSHPEARVKALKDHLMRHAGSIGDELSENFVSLVQNLKIPASWIWEAKALFHKSVQRNPLAEVQCLLKAGAHNDAHETFISRVAPQAIIQQDFVNIADLLQQFAGHEAKISNWRLGGDIYRDFIHLLGLQARPEQILPQLVDKLLTGLPAMQSSVRPSAFGDSPDTSATSDSETVERMAAIMEMGTFVARAVLELDRRGHQHHDLSRVLGLPLAEDGYLKYSMDLSLSYYQELMASAR